MSPITIGFLVLFLGLTFSICKFLYTGYSFAKYIREKYPVKWENMAQKDTIKKALLPFGKGTVTYFIYKSKDDLDDTRVVQFRKTIRQHSLFLFVVYPISFVAYVIVIFWFLEALGTGGKGGSFSFFWN